MNRILSCFMISEEDEPPGSSSGCSSSRHDEPPKWNFASSDLVPALNIYKVGLLWYYSRLQAIDFPVRMNSDEEENMSGENDDDVEDDQLSSSPSSSSSSHSSSSSSSFSSSSAMPAHFFDSTTSCPYVTAVVIKDPRHSAITGDWILQTARDYLPHTCKSPYYSIQVSLDADPTAAHGEERPLNPDLAAAFDVLKADKAHWKVEPHLIMTYDIAERGLPPTPNPEEYELVQIPNDQSDPFEQFETFEVISADAFEYRYIPEITKTHLSMGDTCSPASGNLVSYVRTMVRRKSDGVFVGIGSYMVVPGLDIAYIAEIAVRPECQKRGYGQAIIAYVLSRIHAEGLSKAMLASTPSGIALYLKVGFEVQKNCLTMMATSKRPKQE